jgi:recombinase
LGIKGTLSEAELHFLRARLHGGLLAKARRGELRVRLPVGLVYDLLSAVALDPDQAVREAVGHLLESFQRTGSARAVVKQFATDGVRFPGRHISGPHAGELYWRPLRYEHVLSVAHNPRYAGAYCFGRRRQQTAIDGRAYQVLKPRDQWTVLILDAHPGYISFQQWERNQATLAQNAAARGTERHAGPPREGPRSCKDSSSAASAQAHVRRLPQTLRPPGARLRLPPR